MVMMTMMMMMTMMTDDDDEDDDDDVDDDSYASFLMTDDDDNAYFDGGQSTNYIMTVLFFGSSPRANALSRTPEHWRLGRSGRVSASSRRVGSIASRVKGSRCCWTSERRALPKSSAFARDWWTSGHTRLSECHTWIARVEPK